MAHIPKPLKSTVKERCWCGEPGLIGIKEREHYFCSLLHKAIWLDDDTEAIEKIKQLKGESGNVV